MRRKLLGNDNPDLARSLSDLARVMKDLGQLNDAEQLIREAVGIRRKPGNDRAALAVLLNNLGSLLEQQGCLGEAEATYRESLQTRRDMLGEWDPEVANVLRNLVGCLRKQGRLPEAEALARESLEICQKTIPDHWQAYAARALVGIVLMEEKNYIHAEPLLLEGYEGLEQRLNSMAVYERGKVRTVIGLLVGLYHAMGNADAEAVWKDKLAEFDATQAHASSKP